MIDLYNAWLEKYWHSIYWKDENYIIWLYSLNKALIVRCTMQSYYQRQNKGMIFLLILHNSNCECIHPRNAVSFNRGYCILTIIFCHKIWKTKQIFLFQLIFTISCFNNEIAFPSECSINGCKVLLWTIRSIAINFEGNVTKRPSSNFN